MSETGKLRVNVWQIRNVVAVQIVEQPAWVRAGSACPVASFGEMEFRVEVRPELTRSCLYGRGTDRAGDDKVAARCCDTLRDAEKLVQDVIGVVAEVNKLSPVPPPATTEVKFIVAE